MERKELHFQIPESMLDALDLEAMSRGITRAELLRKIVSKATIAEMDGHKLTQVSVSIEELAHRKIKVCADKAGATMSSVMRILIERALRGSV